MNKPVYIRQTEAESTEGNKLFLCYFLTESTYSERMRYGVGIDMYTQKAECRTLTDRKVADNLFSGKNDAEKFIEVLCRGSVTPVSLDDIIEDNAVI